MCLAVPMMIVEINDDGSAVGELEATTYKMDIALTPDAKVGDYVIVHAGFAIEKLDRQEADARLSLFAEMAESFRAGNEGSF